MRSTRSSNPLRAASSSAACVGCAPRSNSSLAASCWSNSSAITNGVAPLYTFGLPTSMRAPRSSSAVISSVLPLSAARISAVHPLLSTASTSSARTVADTSTSARIRCRISANLVEAAHRGGKGLRFQIFLEEAVLAAGQPSIDLDRHHRVAVGRHHRARAADLVIAVAPQQRAAGDPPRNELCVAGLLREREVVRDDHELPVPVVRAEPVDDLDELRGIVARIVGALR